MRFPQYRISFLLLFLASFTMNLKADNDCLRCHANTTHSIYNDWTERNEKRLMNPYFILDSLRMQAGVHGSFGCVDCHSSDYETYPHQGELKLEPLSITIRITSTKYFSIMLNCYALDLLTYPAHQQSVTHCFRLLS